MLAPLTIEGLEQRFFLQQCPHWWAYNAKKESEKLGQFRNDDPSITDSQDLLQYSWLQLEDFINTYPYGHVKIKVKKNPSDGNDKATRFTVKWGEDQMPVRGFRGQRQASPMMGQQMNMGMWPIFQMMMQQKDDFYRTMMEQSQENTRLNFENQQLAERIEGAEEPNWQETALMKGIDVFTAWLTPKINPGQYQQQAALGTMGQTTEAPAKKSKTKFTANQLLDSIYKDLKGKYTRLEILEVLAIFTQQNTEQADQMIGPMVQQLRAAQNGQ